MFKALKKKKKLTKQELIQKIRDKRNGKSLLNNKYVAVVHKIKINDIDVTI